MLWRVSDYVYIWAFAMGVWFFRRTGPLEPFSIVAMANLVVALLLFIRALCWLWDRGDHA